MELSEADEIHKICSVIGSPSHNSWPQGLELASAARYQFPEVWFLDAYFPSLGCPPHISDKNEPEVT